nr:unnamed protein product [Callosobruchus chinensis]
MSKGHIIIN